MNTTQDISPKERVKWQVPVMETPLWLGKQHPYCVVIPVINEGERIKSLLKRMEANRISAIADIIIVDGGSTDGSLELDSLRQVGVRGLVVKKGPGKLSAQLRCAYAFALDQGYQGIVTIDGNDKDDPEAIPRFIEALEGGIDFVQASRFLPGGVAVNTPKSRDFAIRYIHAPCLSVASGFKWTDTTQGFRAYSRRMLLDPKIAPFRDVFSTYELLAYLSYRAPKLGYLCKELPTKRRYPAGEVPTKISSFKGNLSVLGVLFGACLGGFNPKIEVRSEKMTHSINQKHQIPFNGLFLFIFVLIFASIRLYSSPGSNGNVEQWLNLTNQMFYGHQDFLFSYGPLFWITGGATSQYSSASYWTAILFLSAVYAIFWAAVVWMASEARSIVFLSAVFLLFFQSLQFSNALFLWPFILVIYLDMHRQEEVSRKEFFFYGVLIALVFYIRFFYGVIALATFGTYLVSLAVANKNLRGVAYLSFGLIISYPIIGLFVFHDYSSIVNYALINNQLSFGNSVDMTLDVVNKPQTWVAVAICAIALSVYALIKRRRLFLTVNILILIFLKLGFSRTDHYLHYFVGSLAIMSLLPLFDRTIFDRGVVIISAVCLYYLSISPSFPGAPVKQNVFLPGVNFQFTYENRMQDVYKDFRLSPDLLNYIRGESIDIYPYNNEYAFANNLNYKYRPIFQSYMTLTPKLDAMNQAFFESSRRPQFILWTAGITCNSTDCNPFDSFDGKYALNEDPLTTSSIFLNYHKVVISKGKSGAPLMLLEKNKSVKKYSEIFIKNEKLEFGKWYKVPIAENGLLKLKPELELSMYGKIKNLLFRGGILKVKYKLASGDIKEYRLNILNSRSGIVVSPLLDNFNYSGIRVTQIMLETSNMRYFEPFFDVKWFSMLAPEVKTRNPFDTVSNIPPKYTKIKNIQCEGNIDSVNGVLPPFRIVDVSSGFSVHGWLAYSTRAGELYDQTFLTITDGNGKTSFISTRKESRGDVTAAFHKEALTNSGYVAIIDSSVFDGKSKLGLASVKDSILYKCDQFEVNLNPTQ